MIAASLWRLDFAKRIAPVYAANPHVAAVMVSGSTARGHADRFSDIELGVFWHVPPTDNDRQAAASQVPADLHRLYRYDPQEEYWVDDFFMGRAAPDKLKSGVLVEVGHSTVDTINRTFTEVLEHYDPDPLKQNQIAGILDGIALYGSDLLQTWKEHAAIYPEELALAVVNRQAQIDHFWRSEMWLERGENLMMLYHSFAQIERQLLHVLLGLNRVYYFGFKWLVVVDARLTAKPADLLKRMGEVYQVGPVHGAGLLAGLVEEIYDLIEKLLPRVDINRLRDIFRYRRPQWDAQPPF